MWHSTLNPDVATVQGLSRRVCTHTKMANFNLCSIIQCYECNVRKFCEADSCTFINRRCSSGLMTFNIYVATVLTLSRRAKVQVLCISIQLIFRCKVSSVMRAWRNHAFLAAGDDIGDVVNSPSTSRQSWGCRDLYTHVFVDFNVAPFWWRKIVVFLTVKYLMNFSEIFPHF